MTVVVTGAAGHIGSNLVRNLLGQGRAVRAIVYKDTRALEGLTIDRFAADIRSYKSVRKALEGATTVFHLASHISIVGEESGLVEEVNLLGSENVTRSCLELGVEKLIHFSSIHALKQEDQNVVINESLEPVEKSSRVAYNRTKAAGMEIVRKAVEKKLDAVIILPAAVIGPHDYKPSLMGRVLLDLYHHRLPVLVAGGFHWVDVRDIVIGSLAAEASGRSGEMYLLSGEYLTLSELANLVEVITGVKRPRIIAPMRLALIGAPFSLGWSRLTRNRVRFTPESLQALRCSSRLSCEKAFAELNYKPRPLHDTLTDTFKWFDSMGWLKAGWRPTS